MAGGIYEQSEWPDSRSDYVQVCDGCHTAIWSIALQCRRFSWLLPGLMWSLLVLCYLCFLIDNNKCIYRFAFRQRKRYIVSYEETTERERNIWHEGMAEGTGDFLSPSCCFYGVIGCDCLQKTEWRNSLAAAGFVVFS